MKMVFDTSVIMAILQEEPGYELGKKHLKQSLLSVVNYAELTSRLARNNAPDSAIQRAVRPFEKYITPVDRDTAFLAGTLAGSTRHLGLSLGDRTCLALGLMRDLPVMTADTIWAELDLPIDIILIRERA